VNQTHDAATPLPDRDAYTGLPVAGTGHPQPTDVRRDTEGRIVAVHWRPDNLPATPRAGHWLIAFDGSAYALRAADKLAGLIANGLDAAATVVFAHPWRAKEAAEVVLARDGWALTADARQVFERYGLPLGIQVVMGEPGPVLVEVATRMGCAGIVMGSHGKNALETLLLGSVTQHVLGASTIPVLVTR